MNLVIMQPYFLPYLGYFQLLHASNVFVVYDDVQFIKGGWINRNRFLVNGQPVYFNLSTRGASPNKKINEIELDQSIIWRNKLLRGFDNSYSKNIPYQDFRECLIDIIFFDSENLADYLFYSITRLNSYLELNKKILRSSDLYIPDSLKGKDRVIQYCKNLNAKTYINAPGGVELYSKDEFKQNDIDLKFIKPELPSYTQKGDEFIKGLSIIDVLAYNDKAQISEFLCKYSLE